MAGEDALVEHQPPSRCFINQCEHRWGGIQGQSLGVQGLSTKQTQTVDMPEMGMGKQHRNHLRMLPYGKLFTKGSGRFNQVAVAVFINSAQRYRVSGITGR